MYLFCEIRAHLGPFHVYFCKRMFDSAGMALQFYL